MFSKDPNSKRRPIAGGLLLTCIIATTAFGADAPAPGAAPSAPTGAPPCGRHRDIDLNKMKERAAKRFDAVDTNHDGKITLAEFEAAKPPHEGPSGHPGMGGPGMGSGGPGMGLGGARMGMGHGGPGGTPPTQQERDAQIQAFQTQVFKDLDTDHNGQLSAAEFSKAHEAIQTEMAKQMFAKLDKNSDGVLTKDEFPPFAQKMSALDTNGDGTVSRDEMKAAHAAKGAQNGQTPN